MPTDNYWDRYDDYDRKLNKEIRRKNQERFKKMSYEEKVDYLIEKQIDIEMDCGRK